MKTKFQPIIRKITNGDIVRMCKQQNNGSLPDTTTPTYFVAVDFNIDENIDSRYSKFTDIYIYTSADWSQNINGEVIQPLMVDSNEIYPVNFDTFLAYPMKQNAEFTNFVQPINIHNAKLEGRIKFELPCTSTHGNSETDSKVAYILRVIMKLEN